MATVTATRTFSPLEVRRIMVWPPIWETVAEDGQDPADFKPDVEGDIWLEIRALGKLIGLYHLQKRNSVLIEIHAQVLPEYRKLYSKGSGRAALAWIIENLPDCEKVIAWVPVIYENVRAFCELQGFRVEGTNRGSYLKNGQIHDQWLLGITRGEVEHG